jgi:hypothetical protein
MRLKTSLTDAALFLAAALSATAGTTVYVTNFIGQFGTMDLATGAFNPIGPGLANSIDGLGGQPGGPFYGVDSATGHLIKVNADGSSVDVGDTGTGSQIGPSGVSINGSLTTGALYALDFSNNLLAIDPNTAATISVAHLGAIAPSEQIYIGNLFTSLAGNATDLFFTMEIPTGPLQLAPTLYDINTLTFAVSSVPITGTSNLIGSGWIHGALYGFTGDGNIVTINTQTGAATVVAQYDAGVIPDGPPLTGVFGAADVPEPGTWLAAAGLAMLALRKHR